MTMVRSTPSMIGSFRTCWIPRNVLKSTNLSLHEFGLDTNSNTDDNNVKLPINVETINSSDGTLKDK